MLVMTGQSCISDYRASLTFKSFTLLDIIPSLCLLATILLSTYLGILPFGDIFKRYKFALTSKMLHSNQSNRYEYGFDALEAKAHKHTTT